MTFDFKNLDAETRKLMFDEINDARTQGRLYYSKRFNEEGKEAWAGLAMQASQTYNEGWLAYELEALRCFKNFEYKNTPSGGYTSAHVPDRAAETLADVEFNRYYMIALCRRAIANKKNVVVYRAKKRDDPRPESEALIGQELDPSQLIDQLRALPVRDGHPLVQPNSGLSLHLP